MNSAWLLVIRPNSCGFCLPSSCRHYAWLEGNAGAVEVREASCEAMTQTDVAHADTFAWPACS